MTLVWYIIPITFYISQNNYFGWNSRPMSDAELITDGITLALFVLVEILRRVAQGVEVAP